MRHPSSALPFLCLLALACGLSAPAAPAQRVVRQISIHSGWVGLGASRQTEVVIRHEGSNYLSNGRRLDAVLVQALLKAIDAAPVPAPSLASLGLTQSWLAKQLIPAQETQRVAISEATASQKDLFVTSFTNPAVMARVVEDLYNYSSFDDNPGVRVEIVFEDGAKLSASSDSYFAFMLPWKVSTSNAETYNADLSHALAALLPPKTANRERLAGQEFVSALSEALMRRIKSEWNLRGVESRAGDALATLRTAYTVEAADINPYHNVDHGKPWRANGPHETNLHVTLRKAGFPSNVSEELILLFDHDQVQGVQEFLASGAKYEDLLFSVPWLNDYIRQHADEQIFLIHVHGTSFGDQALHSFTLDMQARGREDLIPEVQKQQSEVVLLKIGFVYWILFPDHRLMLWRFEGPRGFLKWKQDDFPAGRCGNYFVNNGGCSGRFIDPDGSLTADQPPKDLACVAAYRREHPSDTTLAGALFAVTDHNKGGFIDRTGAVRIPVCFDEVSNFSEGLAAFERDGRWGYLDESGTVAIAPQFPWAQKFSEGLARVQATGTVLGYDSRWGFIDKTGNLVIAPDYEHEYDDEGYDTAFHDGLAKVQVAGKTGYLDKTGKFAIPLRFTYAYPFAEGLAAATESPTGDRGWGYIDTSGKWIIPPQFEWGSSFQEQLAPVNRKRNCSYIDRTGSYVLRPPVSPGENNCSSVWGDFSDGFARWKFGNKFGFIDRAGKIVIKPQFDLTFHFSEGLAAVEIAGQWGYIDKTGKMIIEPMPLLAAKDFHNGLAYVVTKDDHLGYIDKSGNYIWKAPVRHRFN
jgi:WG repeat protein